MIDGQKIGNTYDEIREVFLEKNGGSYAYFARPLGSSTYCLYTRYRGNICGLEGYMNPGFSADGSSIIFAGYREGIWSIYRNNERIVVNTQYSNSDISGDYFYFDATNPRSYIFIKRDPQIGYSIIKNGKILPGIWKDIGLTVSFGYDNHIILPVRDMSGWRIAEI
jgi:WD40-like Beta Propeller Repeat